MFAVCACDRFQVTPKALHVYAVKRIFRYLKGKPHLGLWYPKDAPFNLVAYSDSDYAGASLDRKSTTGGCQFLGCRLTTSSTEVDECVAEVHVDDVSIAGVAAECDVSATDDGRMIADMDADKDVTLKDVVAKDVQYAEMEESADIQERQVESQAQIYQIDFEHANKVLSMKDDEVEPTELQEVAEGVVIRDPEDTANTATPSTIIHYEAKSKDKGKWILVEEPKPLKKKIEQDEAYARELEAELNKNIDWDE
nr:hypothetical protein [Tanacetum cinerariifolium]